MIKRKGLNKAVNAILSQHDEDRCWSLYLSTVANPFSETTTFEEFLKKARTPVQNSSKEIEQSLNEKQMEKQLEKATKLLNGFVPMTGGGE